MRLQTGIQTAVGSRHRVNEDAPGVDADLNLWLIADGMGGHAAGDTASAIARDTVLREVRGGSNLAAAIDAAHGAIVAAAAEDPDRHGMGSTIVAVRIDDGRAKFAWVGDSRLYLLRQGTLSCLTRDHSMVQWLLDRGEIDAAEADSHPDRHVLVRTLGFDHPGVDEDELVLEAGDQLLLCSDGISGELAEAELIRRLSEADSAQAAADALVRAVTDIPGKDDASAVVVRVHAAGRGAASAWLPAMLGIGVGVLIYLIWNWVRGS